jgi:CheY-like chemotaxis protein
MSAPLRVVIGEDDVLLREGIARLLTEAGFSVVAQAGDAPDLLREGLAHRPSVVIADVSMPPGHGDDGLRAAIEARQQRPETGVLVLSQYYEERYALDLIGERAEGVGYLLKERVGDVESFIDAVRQPVFDRGEDVVSLGGDCPGQLNERRQPTSSCPGKPLLQELLGLLGRHPVDLPELLLEQVCPVQRGRWSSGSRRAWLAGAQ